MASSPKYKVYNETGLYVAACKHPWDAAILVTIGYPSGGTVRLYHGATLFTSSEDSNDSYDAVTEAIMAREKIVHQESYDRAYFNKARTE